MNRRTALPGADELFRATGETGQPAPRQRWPEQPAAPAAGAARTRVRAGARGRAPTGRERHEEKITVYVSAAELLDVERARLALRGDHGLAVDRGRIVREALAHVLADLEAHGEASVLVRRLRSR
ncbi:MAG: hypothetical protein ACR2K2_15095 [Mycobacteriales bacterium]